MVNRHYEAKDKGRRVSRTQAWRDEKRRVCRSPAGMLASAAALRLITGPEGRRLYGGKVPASVVRSVLAKAARLEREAGVWGAELAERALAGV